MSDFITLSCPSCGAKLEITQDINRFACSYCGQEHIVKRSGGIIFLSPVIEAINQVKSGVDKTAAELALKRIPIEIEALENEQNNLLKAHPYPTKTPKSTVMGYFVFGAFLIFISILFISNSDMGMFPLLCLIPGIGLIALGFWRISKSKTKTLVEERQAWEDSIGVDLRLLIKQITSKQEELERNRKLVSE